ncbi:acylphosphatase [Zoogloeaceae bacteirum Par-f-2]|jgi:acylphosphatase|uniref:acylphosphatase n=1 Tax=Pseudothauera hydrothermalis TaxID=2184083 RepID=UPI000C7E3B51|nr:acylphosphatase [Pseudothauera hydrothermalis]AUM00629.1 acylphosphatase [Rhodocyclaceae bacterium]AVZ79741.1 acylphosphatase [Zoogloeaceae bacteirum Par-f-2]
MPEHASASSIARSLRILGRVQGVFYRASAKAQADRLGLRGWVRNKRDGSVEALVAGPAEAIDRFIDWAYQGPAQARVERIEIGAADAPQAAGFRILPDA